MQPAQNNNSQLVQSLREAVGLVQMIVFKEIRKTIDNNQQQLESTERSMLAGSITNEIFGTPNPEEKFAAFRTNHWGVIEQELLSIKESNQFLCRHITDALRIQTLCDSQEGEDSSDILLKAKQYGYLLEEREVPLPSTFMTIIRELGKEHGLVVPPVQVTAEQDKALIH
ncbi:hypothetical protein [Desulforhopalus sp. 52FAK]